MDDYESMSLEELTEAYAEILDLIRQNDVKLGTLAGELATLTESGGKGDLLLVQQSIRWERVGKLLEDVGELLQENAEWVEELNTINWHYTNKSGQ